MTSLSQALGQRGAADWAGRFPQPEREALRAIVRTAFVDTAACIVAGRDDPSVARVLQWTEGRAGQGGTSSVLFGAQRFPAPLAALVNGVAGHALDYDDTGLAGHPSVVLVPALLAEHERSGLSGFALVQAYAKGYAVWGELQRRLNASLHARGWHPTAVFGLVAVAAAIASARNLDAARTAHALGITASMSCGVVANFGSMTKPLQVGRAIESGFHAVELAGLGIDASADALDGRTGLLAALVGACDADCESPVAQAFESTLLLQRPGIKKYPICYAAHRVVDGVLDLAREHGLRLQDVERVDATISTTTASVLRHHRPATVTEARFSLEFAVAAALLHRRVGLHEVSEATLENPEVQGFLPRVETHTTDTRCPLESSFALTDEVLLTLKDGRVLSSGPIRFPRGHGQLPLDEEQLLEKLFGCVRAGEDGLARGVLQTIDSALDG